MHASMMQQRTLFTTGARPAAAACSAPTAARWPLPTLHRRRRAGVAAAGPSSSSGKQQQQPERNRSRSRTRGSNGQPKQQQLDPQSARNNNSNKRDRDDVTPQFATAALSRAALPRHLVAAWERYGDARNARHIAAATKRVAVMAPEALQRAHERRRLIYEQQREQQQERSRERSRSRAPPPRKTPLRPYALEPDLRALTAVAVSAAGAALSLGERSQGGLEDGALVSVACALAGVLTTLQKAEAQGFLVVAAASPSSSSSTGAPADGGASVSTTSSSTAPTATAAADIAAAAAGADASLLRVSLAHVSDALLPRLGRLPPRRLQQALWALSSLAQSPQSQQQQPQASSPPTPPSAPSTQQGLVSTPLDANPYDSSAPVVHPAAVATATRGASVAASYRRAGEWLRAFEAASARQLRASAAAAAGAEGGDGQQQQQQQKGWSHGGDVISLPSLAQILASLVRLGYCPGAEWWSGFWAASRPALVAAAAAGAAGGGGGGGNAGSATDGIGEQQQQKQLDPQLVQELLGGASRSPASRAADLSRVIHAVARLGARLPTAAAQEKQRGAASSSSSSSSSSPSSPPWTDLFLDASCAWLPYSGAEDLTRTVWALGCLGARPHRAWLMLFFLVSRRSMALTGGAGGGGGGGGGGRAQPGDLALWLQALARLGYKPSPAWLGDYVAATYPYLAAAEAAGVVGGSGEGAKAADANAAGPRGRARSRSQQQQQLANSTNSAQAMQPADTANLAWAAAAMAWQPPWRYWLALLAALRAALPRLAPRDVANAAWAVGRLAGAPVLGSSEEDGAWMLAASGEQGVEAGEKERSGGSGSGGSGGSSGSSEDDDDDAEAEAAIAQQLPDGWLAEFCRLSSPALASMSGRELALTAGALASLRALPGPAWLGALAEAAGARLAQQQQQQQGGEGGEGGAGGQQGLRASECRALAGAMARLALRPAPPALLRLQGDLLRAAEEMEEEAAGKGSTSAAAGAGAGAAAAGRAAAVEVV